MPYIDIADKPTLDSVKDTVERIETKVDGIGGGGEPVAKLLKVTPLVSEAEYLLGDEIPKEDYAFRAYYSNAMIKDNPEGLQVIPSLATDSGESQAIIDDAVATIKYTPVGAKYYVTHDFDDGEYIGSYYRYWFKPTERTAFPYGGVFNGSNDIEGIWYESCNKYISNYAPQSICCIEFNVKKPCRIVIDAMVPSYDSSLTYQLLSKLDTALPNVWGSSGSNIKDSDVQLKVYYRTFSGTVDYGTVDVGKHKIYAYCRGGRYDASGTYSLFFRVRFEEV